jgi:hypothetical protein
MKNKILVLLLVTSTTAWAMDDMNADGLSSRPSDEHVETNKEREQREAREALDANNTKSSKKSGLDRLR